MPKPRTGVRYTIPTGAQGENQPGSRGRVLRNTPGIISKSEMDRGEFEALVKAQDAYLEIIGPETRFTAEIIRDMHRRWLGGIYAWAGEYRAVELQKGSFRWPPAFLVARNMDAFETDTLRRNTPCRPGTVLEIAHRIAEVHAEFLLIHPFRDGNGRLARWLADLMAMQAGLPAPEYTFEGRKQKQTRDRYLAAVTRGYVQDYEPLADFFAVAILRRLEARA